MNLKWLNELIQKDECEYLDFKQEFTGHNLDLIHDILCLANARTEKTQDRYLIYGVDDDKNIVGLDVNIPVKSHITNFLRNKVNKIPKLGLRSFKIDEKIVKVLIIKDLPHKPYCLNADYPDEKELNKHKSARVIRAGVVYERENDNNTPVNTCANFDNVKSMYTEQFESGYSIEEEVVEELKHPERWKYVTGERYYHSKKRGLSINIDNGQINNRVNFTVLFQDKIATVYKYEIHYDNNLIKELEVLLCASGELLVPYPNNKPVGEALDGDKSPTSYYYIKDSYEHLLKNFLTYHYYRTLKFDKITSSSMLKKFDSVVALFNSEKVAINQLEADYKSPKRKYTYFHRRRGGCEVIKPDETYFVKWVTGVNTVDDQKR